MAEEQSSFRLGERTNRLLAQLADQLSLSKTDVVRQAIRLLARRELPRKRGREKSDNRENGA